MIVFFPEPYPDELFYSICARYADQVQYPSNKSVVQDLFGSITASAIVDLPSRLNILIDALPRGHGYAVKQLIDNHTLLPFYSPFLPSDRVSCLRQDMEGDNGLLAQMRSGITGSCICLPEWLRFCPLCSEEDQKQFDGGRYWHRLHQVPGVEVCPIHHIFLENSKVRAQAKRSRYELISANQAIEKTSSRLLNPSDPCQKVLLRIAQDAAWLLKQRELVPGLEFIRARYLWLLTEPNLASREGKVRVSALLKAFKSYYSYDLLERLQCVPNEQDKNNWLFRLVRSPKQARHPLYHLLLIQFLGYTAEEFFQLPDSPPDAFQPFGSKPWPCLNPVCQQFQQLSIQECQVIYDKQHSRITGTFSCTCGFTYSRLGSDSSAEDRFRIGKVKSYGQVWERTLKNFWENPTVSVEEIAKHLRVDYQTVKRQALRLGLSFPRPGPTARVAKINGELLSDTQNGQVTQPSKLESYRMAWLEAVKENPHIGRTALERMFQRIHAWLYVHDKKWLKAHLPPCKTRVVFSPQVDWKKRDHELATAAKFSAQGLKTSLGRPVKLTKTAIASDLGQLKLIEQQKDKLPRTTKALEELAETREEFAVRRIQWASKCFRQENVYPTRWQLLRQAGIRPDLAEVPQVKEAITVALKSLDASANHNCLV
ncbi:MULTISPECIES: TnsD family Tn7-like transposition protein [Cyanophyceae]|uniref:TnsD family Tn7-like transposition protein n=1 Tax=Cyanophyceae TaxID=3028117 RepID=UPI00168753D5|nr:TnsD family Tn7-like transposition protein [Trichocoleus sp. FACHB-69]MBD1932268.1 TniQ family protein [Trichocoleus sp. FACHB-69]